MKKLKIFCSLFVCAALGLSVLGGCTDPLPKEEETPTGGSTLVDYEQYKDEYYIDIAAWGFPTLETDANGSYDTEKNNALVQDMVNAGFTSVNHAGLSNVRPNRHGTAEEVTEIIKERIALFEQNGLQSNVYCSNYTNGGNSGTGASWWDFDVLGMPDFSESAGFRGLLVWDEPYPGVMEKLAGYARTFNELYAGTDAIFMVNLYPSYASLFTTGGYGDYLESYCDTVLSAVEGTKYISVDSYAIRADKQLETYLLYDIAMVKKYADEYGAYSHMALQSSMTSTKDRIPELGECAVQAYAALAFGIDSLSWYTYITPEEEPYVSQDREDGIASAPVNEDGTKNDAYYSLQKVNTDIAAFGYAYKCFDWKGIMMNPVTQLTAMNRILRDRELIDLVYYPEDTKSVVSAESEQDFLMGVMEDEKGNEGFLLVNYCSLADAADAVVELEFRDADTLLIWRDGKKETLPLEDGRITLTLSQGQGAFMVPYKAEA